MKNSAEKVFIGTMILIFTIIGGIGYPLYNVWTSEQAGIAELRKAEGNRKIAIQEAEANRIIGDSLKNNEAYLRYLWIRNLEDGPNQIIYVPTEANLPLLESSRHIAYNLSSKDVLND